MMGRHQVLKGPSHDAVRQAIAVEVAKIDYNLTSGRWKVSNIGNVSRFRPHHRADRIDTRWWRGADGLLHPGDGRVDREIVRREGPRSSLRAIAGIDVPGGAVLVGNDEISNAITRK